MSSSTRAEASSSSYDQPSVVAAQKAFSNGSRRPHRSIEVALSQAPTLQQHDSSGNITEEDYDHLKLDPYAVVSGAHGGGFEEPKGKLPLRFTSETLSKNAETRDYVLHTHDEDVEDILKGSIGVVSPP